MRTNAVTQSINQQAVATWKVSDGQRPFKANAKVKSIARWLASTGKLPGIIHIGILSGKPVWYIVDGQHRVRAFQISGLEEVEADIRFIYANSMAELDREYVQINSYVNRFQPADYLRGMVSSTPNLQMILKECPFVKYDGVIKLSVVLRSWIASASDSAGTDRSMTVDTLLNALGEVPQLVRFLSIVRDVFPGSHKLLWQAANLYLCMRAYRRFEGDALQFEDLVRGINSNQAYCDDINKIVIKGDQRAKAVSIWGKHFERRGNGK